jgi:hypothetical protein
LAEGLVDGRVDVWVDGVGSVAAWAWACSAHNAIKNAAIEVATEGTIEIAIEVPTEVETGRGFLFTKNIKGVGV